MKTITVNGAQRTVQAADTTPLLYVLRDELGLTGTKYGCGMAQCGACTILIGTRAVPSCVTPLAAVNGAVTTIEGLGTPEKPHPIQRAFIEEQAAQCGYCTAGMVMRAAALLNDKRRPTDAEIRAGMEGNLCRCGSHMRVLRAIHRAAGAQG
jgi:nicotinate dehydrogenase subunit A